MVTLQDFIHRLKSQKHLVKHIKKNTTGKYCSIFSLRLVVLCDFVHRIRNFDRFFFFLTEVRYLEVRRSRISRTTLAHHTQSIAVTNKTSMLRRFPLNVRTVRAKIKLPKKYLQHCHILRTDKKNLSLLLLPS